MKLPLVHYNDNFMLISSALLKENLSPNDCIQSLLRMTEGG